MRSHTRTFKNSNKNKNNKRNNKNKAIVKTLMVFKNLSENSNKPYYNGPRVIRRPSQQIANVQYDLRVDSSIDSHYVLDPHKFGAANNTTAETTKAHFNH